MNKLVFVDREKIGGLVSCYSEISIYNEICGPAYSLCYVTSLNET